MNDYNLEWSVSIITRDRTNAGSTANAFLTLYGKMGVTKKLPFPLKDIKVIEKGYKYEYIYIFY